MPPAKNFFASSINWLGLLTVMLSLLQMLEGAPFIQANPQLTAVITMIVGALTMILRTFNPNPPISQGVKLKAMLFGKSNHY